MDLWAAKDTEEQIAVTTGMSEIKTPPPQPEESQSQKIPVAVGF